MSEENKQPLFEDNSMALAARTDAAAVARATQEIQAALVIGQRFPRDEIKAKSRILQACQRKDLAELAEYDNLRGGTRITGPTIDLLRAIANRWGNIRFGWEEIERRQGESTVRCQAWDTQSNGHAFRSFVVKHWRDRSDTKGGGYELDDERDIYEMLANVAARRVRACLEEVIDADIVSAAIEQCRKTLREGEKTPLKDRAVHMLNRFAEFGVTKERIEKRLGNSLESVSENQMAHLYRIFKSLKDGVGKPEDYFKPDMAAPQFSEAGKAPAGGNTTVVATAAGSLLPAVGAPASTSQPEDDVPFEFGGKPPLPVQLAMSAQEAALRGDPTAGLSLKLLRSALKTAKIKEGVLLGALFELGVTDGSFASLEDLALSQGGSGVIQKVIDNWSSLSQRIIEAQKGGSRVSRQLVCRKCSKEYKPHPEDVAAGWHHRQVFVSAVTPQGHGITMNGVFHPLSELLCDLCSEPLTGQIVVAVTMWRGQEIGHWESEYGTVLDEEAVQLADKLAGDNYAKSTR